MQDSFGDVCNGGTHLVTLDVETEIEIEFLDGAEKTETFEVLSSTETISIVHSWILGFGSYFPNNGS